MDWRGERLFVLVCVNVDQCSVVHVASHSGYEQTALRHGGRAVELHDLIGHLYEAWQEDNELNYDEPPEDEEHEGVERCAEHDTCDEVVYN